MCFVDEFVSARAGASAEDDGDDEETAVSFFPTPRDVHGKDPVYVGRVRASGAFENGVSLWVAADNLRKGAALNAIQIIDVCSRNGAFDSLRARRAHG